MEKTVPELMAAISPEDWEKVPQSVKEAKNAQRAKFVHLANKSLSYFVI